MSSQLSKLPKSSRSHSSGQKGQGLVEYALILVLVAIVSIVILALLGPAVGNVFSNVIANLNGDQVAIISNPTSAPAATTAPVATAVPAPTATATIITGAAARTQYCVDRPGYVGGVNWGSATYTFVSGGQTYQVTGSWNCPYP